VTLATDSGLSSRINLVILDGPYDFRSTFNTGPGRNSRASPFGADSLEKVFFADEPKFLGPLMRFVRGDVRDQIASPKIDYGPS
jgi:hypothetical protein